MLKIISLIFKLISLLFVAFLVWFGFTFYKHFSAMEERGMTRVAALEDAFLHTSGVVKDLFEEIYSGNIKDALSLFSSKISKEASAKELFIDSRGVPEVYFKIISYDVLREDGIYEKRKDPLYIDIWFYGKPYNKKVVFENGYFKEEKAIKNTDDFIENKLSPLKINKNITEKKLIAIVGESDCVLTSEDINIETYRFKESAERPLLSATFVDGKLMFLSSGVIFLSENEEKICP